MSNLHNVTKTARVVLQYNMFFIVPELSLFSTFFSKSEDVASFVRGVSFGAVMTAIVFSLSAVPPYGAYAGIYKEVAPPRHGQLVSVVPPTHIAALSIFMFQGNQGLFEIIFSLGVMKLGQPRSKDSNKT